MATRGVIGVMYGDVCKSIYVHWDSYLGGVGATLLENYGRVGASELIACGNVSSLHATIPDTRFFDQETECLTANNFEEFLEQWGDSWIEYMYIMGMDEQWYVVRENHSLQLLSEALAAERALDQMEKQA
jgi:hypothetical protein